MARHLVCLTFDFDAMSGFVARGFTSPTPVSRGEFGNVGARRILDLLARHGIRATWFVPGVIVNTYPDTCRRMVDEGHELAHHGWTHVAPANLTREEEERGLVRGNEAIQAVAGEPARGYRSPSWDLSPHTVDLLLANGFDYDSSMMAHDHQPYQARTGDKVHPDEPIEFGPITNLVELPVSWSLDDHPHFEFYSAGATLMPGLRNTNSVLENWLDDFRYLCQTETWGVLTITCHPYVIGRGHRMLMLDQLIAQLTNMGAEFVTAENAVLEFKQQKSER